MNRSIGVFDSGIGGLTVLKELMQVLPNENYIYIGDNKNCPYGDKTKEELYSYATGIINYFVKRDVKLIVIACNTTSSTILDKLKEAYNVPIIGVIDATVEDFINRNLNSTLVIATSGTINSSAYVNKINMYNDNIKVYSKATPLLVPAIESNDSNINSILHSYLDEYKNNIDSIILGCTHYPLIESDIKNVLGNVEIISSSKSVAKTVYNYLSENSMLNNNFKIEVYTTGDINSFKIKSRNIIECEVKFIDLEGE